MGTESMGLRESKKQETRQLISDHATRLFIEQGFEQTTIAEIATAARVAKKTVTNYFARKEDMALDHHEEFTATLARAVAGRAAGESALAVLRREFAAAVERCDPVAGFAGPEFARMIADSPTLTTRLRELHDRREEALAEALAAAAPATRRPSRPGPPRRSSEPPTGCCSGAFRSSPSPGSPTSASRPRWPRRPRTPSISSKRASERAPKEVPTPDRPAPDRPTPKGPAASSGALQRIAR